MLPHSAVINWQAILADMTPTRDRVIGGARCALAMTIAALWGITIELPQPYWGVISAALLSQPLATTTAARTLMRVAGTAIGGIVAVSMAAAFLGNPPAYLVCVGIVCFCSGYLWTGSRYPYAVAVFALTVMLITYGAINDPNNVQSTAWNRTLEVSSGAIAVAIATWILPGVRAMPRLRTLSASKVRRLAHGLDPLIDAGVGRAKIAMTLDPVAAERYIAMHELLQLAEGESSKVWTHRARWFELLGTIERARITLDDVAFASSGPDAQRIAAPVRAELSEVARSLSDGCERLAQEIEQFEIAGGTWAHGGALDDADAAMLRVHARLHELRTLGTFTGWTVQDVSRLYGVVQSLDSAVRDIRRSHELLVEIRNVDAPVREYEGQVAEAAKVFAVFPIERFRVRHGIKNALASVIGLVLALAIPGGYGAPLMMTVQLLSASPNFGAMVQKSILRFTGTLIGGALAIVFIIAVIPNLFSVGGLLLWAAPFLFAFGYLLCCGTRVAYAGLQMALTFGMVVLPSNVPASDLWPATDRLVGVFVGAAIVGIVFNYIAPHRAIDDYRQGMAQLCHAIADYLGLAASAVGRDRIPEPKRLGIRQRVYSSAAQVTASVAGMEFDRSDIRSGLSRHDLAVAPADARVLYRATIAMVMSRQSLPDNPPETIRRAVDRAFAAVRQETEAIAAIWDSGHGGLDPAVASARRAAIGDVEAAIEAERKAHPVFAMTTPEAEAVVAQIAHLTRMGEQLDAMGAMVGRLARSRPADPELATAVQPIPQA
jgi:uncharacterized membrane protein YccC